MRVRIVFIDGEKLLIDGVPNSDAQRLRVATETKGFWSYDNQFINTGNTRNIQITADADENVEERDTRMSEEAARRRGRRLKLEKAVAPKEIVNNKLTNRIRTPRRMRGRRT